MAHPLLAFPATVNEHAARVTAGLVVLLTLATILTTGPTRLLLLTLLTLGFALRVVGGPRYSPLARFSVHVLVPLLRRPPRLTAGAPKRFAQALGLAFSATALSLSLPGWHHAATVTLVMLAAAATLEAAFGFCLGCRIFGQLIRLGLIPEDVCADCADVTARYARAKAPTLEIPRAEVDIHVR
ncbi:MAG: DUF4395 domain-containing protein [Corynebacterium humireducens]|jgi:hypothetical protein|uniref:DUF4395 domain-containing protein n=1 Tax=Corynebacterium humireducens TaxID=1223514 RepID=A0A7X6PLU5_9CORY|nr:DUF4395 domain-containing protein [Corynebacterium humireducens]